MRATTGARYDVQASTGASAAAALVEALCHDPQTLARLAQALVAAGLADEVHASIQSAVTQHARQEAGRLVAGVVATGTGWLIPATAFTPAKAMVFLGGSALAVACVVATSILPDLTPGAQVWVEPVNGSAADLLIVALRAFVGTPAVTSQGSQIATNTSAIAANTSALGGKVAKAGDTMTGPLTVNGAVSFDNGTIHSNGSGTLTAVQFLGAVSVDVESSQTVFRPGSGAIDIIIQVNGHNWQFRNDGVLITPSGANIT